MNPNFNTVIQASDDERCGLFLTAAARLGTTVQNIEKDFWVCWTLDALFSGLPPDGPRLLFKGGTSLSKAFGTISRFSEDIDITVFRQDIGEPIEAEDLDALSGKQRRIRLDRIRNACQRYIAEGMAAQLREIAEQIMCKVDPCPPRDPAKKGIVESGVKYVKSSFLPLCEFRDLDDANHKRITGFTASWNRTCVSSRRSAWCGRRHSRCPCRRPSMKCGRWTSCMTNWFRRERNERRLVPAFEVFEQR